MSTGSLFSRGARVAVVLATIASGFVVAVSSVALLVPPAAGATPAVNLLQDPGFETDADANGTPDSWNPHERFGRATTPRHGGSYSARFQGTQNKSAETYQQVTVTGGADYTFSGWVNAPVTTDAFTFQLQVQWRTRSALGSVTIKKYEDDTAGAWQLVSSGTLQAPANATAARIRLVGSGLSTSVYVDDVAFGRASPGATPTPSPTRSPTPSPGGAVLVGAGDIANCGTSQDEATAALLDGIAGTVFTAGDNAYPDGSDANFDDCHAPTWGRHLARTRPAPGNHDYHQPGASDYFEYFGAQAGPAGLGYYAYDLGAWRVYSLNSQVVTTQQVNWLVNDLAANPRSCVAAYWHHPRFATGYTNGTHGNNASTEPLWDALADAGAELVLNGHSHQYERFEAKRGVVEVIVGTGGTGLNPFATPFAPGSLVQNATDHGVLKLTLTASGFSGQFIPIAGKTFTDSFSGTCH